MGRLLLSVLIVVYMLLACDNDDMGSKRSYFFDFKAGTEEWNGFFSDYPVGAEEFYELEFEYSNLPVPLDSDVKCIKIAGNNHSDDLFSAIYRKFDGLMPNGTYSVTFEIVLASNAPTDAFGIGGSPDLSLGAGGIPFVPKNTVDIENHYRPNFESNLQSGLSSPILQVLGTIGVSDSIPTPYTLINRNNLDTPMELSSNQEGEMYIMIAIDSGFEGITTLYYKSIEIHME
jgi:hypothetical protein